MITLLAALVLSRDPYSGFRAIFRPFGENSLYPITVERLKSKGFDMTSLLYQDREKLSFVLNLASDPAKFNADSVNLLVSMDKRTWAVDTEGVVLFEGHPKKLSKGEFKQLRTLISMSLPNIAPESPEKGGV